MSLLLHLYHVRLWIILLGPYAQAMFTCGLKETRGGEVALRDTPAQSLELLLGYMYRAELPLSDENIQGVAAAAFLLHVDGAFRWEIIRADLTMNRTYSGQRWQWARQWWRKRGTEGRKDSEEGKQL